MEEPRRVRLLVGLWLFWQRLRSGDLEGHILGFYCAQAPPRGIEIVKRLQGLLLLEEFQPVSKQISGQHQHVYYCTPSFAFLIQTTYNRGEVFFLCKLWSPPLPLPP